jgi:hypothetical protein
MAVPCLAEAMKRSFVLFALCAATLGFGQSAPADERDNFQASAFIGLSVDAFSAQATDQILYGNAQENGTKRERIGGGFDFSYRLAGDPKGKTTKPWSPQLWVYGRTVHGVRSAEVNCTGPANAIAPVCATGENPFSPAALANPQQQLLYLLRNASSLEAHLGLRAEFLQLNAMGTHPAHLYVKAQAGFLSIARSGGDVFDVHQLMLGAVDTAGVFEGSYIEGGYGRDDMFRIHRYRRVMVNGYLTWHVGTLGGLKPFIGMSVDSDASYGADSVQTFMGLALDLDKLF